MKVHLKNTLISISPTVSDALLRAWHLRVRPADHVVNRTHRISDELRQRYHGRIAGGMFKNMRYAPTAFGSAMLPKLVGSYEVELNPALIELTALNPKTLVDIGCAEGYYAVGLAMLLPESVVYAFDTSAAARALCRRTARMNGVLDRVEIRGLCTHQVLESLDLNGGLVVCDCEGCESTLLNPELAPSLLRAFIIVELHEHLVSGTKSTLTSRFENSHDISEIPVEERRPDELSCLSGMAQDDRALAIREARVPGQSWLVMKPKSNPKLAYSVQRP